MGDVATLFGTPPNLSFALAKGFQVMDLSTLIGNEFAGFAGMSPILMILLISLCLTFLTELTSNTATTEMILPILASAGFAMQANPL